MKVLLYVPGIIQLTLIPALMFLFQTNQMGFLSNFSLYSNYAHGNSKRTVALVLKSPRNENCNLFDEYKASSILKIQNELNTMQRNYTFRMNEKLSREISKLTPCFVVILNLVRFNKLDYVSTHKIESSTILWKSE